MKNAVNVDPAHEFAKWVLGREGAALWATAFSANPVGKGAGGILDPEVSACCNGTFNDDALAKLWWWPEQTADLIAKRAEYADIHKAAQAEGHRPHTCPGPHGPGCLFLHASETIRDRDRRWAGGKQAVGRQGDNDTQEKEHDQENLAR